MTKLRASAKQLGKLADELRAADIGSDALDRKVWDTIMEGNLIPPVTTSLEQAIACVIAMLPKVQITIGNHSYNYLPKGSGSKDWPGGVIDGGPFAALRMPRADGRILARCDGKTMPLAVMAALLTALQLMAVNEAAI